MFGSHLSIAGSMLNALDEAQSLGLDTVQVFTKNQQQWKAKPLDPGVVRDWRARVEALGWGRRTVSHASYLINLASPNDELWNKSIDLMTDEIERCEQLGIPFLVHHPGAHTTSTREQGLSRIAEAYRILFKRTSGCRTVSCLENTVGSGSNLGREFEELADLRGRIVSSTGESARVGFCFDTCHAHAGGYDLSTAAGVAECFDAWDRMCGLASLKVFHMNDSKAPAASRRDRHEHIGQGTIGRAGFGAIMRHAAMTGRPKIMETPKGDAPGGGAWDAVNLGVLRALLAGDVEPPPPGERTPSARTPAKVAARATPGKATQRKPKAMPASKSASKVKRRK